jgi:toxin ParE1/3/4
MKLVLSRRAQEDLFETWEYIAEHDELAADHYIDYLRERAMELLEFPELGRMRNEICPELRSLLARNHLLFYRIHSDEIQILRILHGSRDLPNQEFPDSPEIS